MFFYSHRINSLNSLKEVNKKAGVEIDLREYKSDLILSHDPFSNNFTYLKDFLPFLNGRNIIANVKSERIEKKFLEIKDELAPNSDYFFLDSSLSMVAKFGGLYNFASRFSEFESIETTINLLENSLINWLWIDTFTLFPINKKNVSKINSIKINKCFTSPDLLGREKQIPDYAKLIRELDLKIDAICCKNKNINLWKSFLKN